MRGPKGLTKGGITVPLSGRASYTACGVGQKTLVNFSMRGPSAVISSGFSTTGAIGSPDFNLAIKVFGVVRPFCVKEAQNVMACRQGVTSRRLAGSKPAGKPLKSCQRPNASSNFGQELSAERMDAGPPKFRSTHSRVSEVRLP